MGLRPLGPLRCLRTPGHSSPGCVYTGRPWPPPTFPSSNDQALRCPSHPDDHLPSPECRPASSPLLCVPLPRGRWSVPQASDPRPLPLLSGTPHPHITAVSQASECQGTWSPSPQSLRPPLPPPPPPRHRARSPSLSAVQRVSRGAQDPRSGRCTPPAPLGGKQGSWAGSPQLQGSRTRAPRPLQGGSDSSVPILGRPRAAKLPQLESPASPGAARPFPGTWGGAELRITQPPE